jgi:hypothetical protein
MHLSVVLVSISSEAKTQKSGIELHFFVNYGTSEMLAPVGELLLNIVEHPMCSRKMKSAVIPRYEGTVGIVLNICELWYKRDACASGGSSSNPQSKKSIPHNVSRQLIIDVQDRKIKKNEEEILCYPQFASKDSAVLVSSGEIRIDE